MGRNFRWRVVFNKTGRIADEYARMVPGIVEQTSDDIGSDMSLRSAVDTGTQKESITVWSNVSPSDGTTRFVNEVGPDPTDRTPDGRLIRSPIYQELGPSGAGFQWRFTPFAVPAVLGNAEAFLRAMSKVVR